MNKNLLLFPFVLFSLILLIFLYLLIIDRNPSQIPSNLLNKKVPKFESQLLLKESKFISSNEFSKEIVLVNFFATWCLPCRDEHNYIKRFSDKKGIRVIGINYKDKSINTVKWLKDLGNPYSDIPIDENGSIAIDWGVYGIPETFLINSKGIIKYRHAGPITDEVYNKINKIINKNE